MAILSLHGPLLPVFADPDDFGGKAYVDWIRELLKTGMRTRVSRKKRSLKSLRQLPDRYLQDIGVSKVQVGSIQNLSVFDLCFEPGCG